MIFFAMLSFQKLRKGLGAGRAGLRPRLPSGAGPIAEGPTRRNKKAPVTGADAKKRAAPMGDSTPPATDTQTELYATEPDCGGFASAGRSITQIAKPVMLYNYIELGRNQGD